LDPEYFEAGHLEQKEDKCEDQIESHPNDTILSNLIHIMHPIPPILSIANNNLRLSRGYFDGCRIGYPLNEFDRKEQKCQFFCNHFLAKMSYFSQQNHLKNLEIFSQCFQNRMKGVLIDDYKKLPSVLLELVERDKLDRKALLAEKKMGKKSPEQISPTPLSPPQSSQLSSSTPMLKPVIPTAFSSKDFMKEFTSMVLNNYNELFDKTNQKQNDKNEILSSNSNFELFEPIQTITHFTKRNVFNPYTKSELDQISTIRNNNITHVDREPRVIVKSTHQGKKINTIDDVSDINFKHHLFRPSEVVFSFGGDLLISSTPYDHHPNPGDVILLEECLEIEKSHFLNLFSQAQQSVPETVRIYCNNTQTFNLLLTSLLVCNKLITPLNHGNHPQTKVEMSDSSNSFKLPFNMAGYSVNIENPTYSHNKACDVFDIDVVNDILDSAVGKIQKIDLEKSHIFISPGNPSPMDDTDSTSTMSIFHRVQALINTDMGGNHKSGSSFLDNFAPKNEIQKSQFPNWLSNYFQFSTHDSPQKSPSPPTHLLNTMSHQLYTTTMSYLFTVTPDTTCIDPFYQFDWDEVKKAKSKNEERKCEKKNEKIQPNMNASISPLFSLGLYHLLDYNEHIFNTKSYGCFHKQLASGFLAPKHETTNTICEKHIFSQQRAMKNHKILLERFHSGNWGVSEKGDGVRSSKLKREHHQQNERDGKNEQNISNNKFLNSLGYFSHESNFGIYHPHYNPIDQNILDIIYKTSQIADLIPQIEKWNLSEKKNEKKEHKSGDNLAIQITDKQHKIDKMIQINQTLTERCSINCQCDWSNLIDDGIIHNCLSFPLQPIISQISNNLHRNFKGQNSIRDSNLDSNPYSENVPHITTIQTNLGQNSVPNSPPELEILPNGQSPPLPQTLQTHNYGLHHNHNDNHNDNHNLVIKSRHAVLDKSPPTLQSSSELSPQPPRQHFQNNPIPLRRETIYVRKGVSSSAAPSNDVDVVKKTDKTQIPTISQQTSQTTLHNRDTSNNIAVLTSVDSNGFTSGPNKRKAEDQLEPALIKQPKFVISMTEKPTLLLIGDGGTAASTDIDTNFKQTDVADEALEQRGETKDSIGFPSVPSDNTVSNEVAAIKLTPLKPTPLKPTSLKLTPIKTLTLKTKGSVLTETNRLFTSPILAKKNTSISSNNNNNNDILLPDDD
jgi:hypothetical protein